MTIGEEWFEAWFESTYYDLLYEKRDENEAHRFITNLLTYFKPQKGSRILDLACGAGRFSKFLAQKDFQVVGLDLSEKNIRLAKQFENDHLTFYVHDMRNIFRTNYFDYVFNFFTSFGYFQSKRDHLRTLVNVRKQLKADGTFVLDFLNVNKVLSRLPQSQTVQKNEVIFEIEKQLKSGYIEKKIKVKEGTVHSEFVERVRAFTLNDFYTLFNEAGLQVVSVFGDYDLSAFDENNSERLIIIGKRNG